MKKTLVCLFVFICLSLSAAISVKFYAKPGYIFDKKRKVRYVLNCGDTLDFKTPCYFIISLKNGKYVFTSRDTLDRFDFVVKNDTLITTYK